MNKQLILILSAVAAAIIIAAGLAWFVINRAPQAQEMTDDEHTTNGALYFEDNIPPADPLMVGRWQNIDNPQWYKVYYDDYADEDFYWGKEWDESDDVQEEDLNYHGNGWFRWRKHGNELQELHTMDTRDVPIVKIYIVTENDEIALCVKEKGRKETYRFRR